MSLVVQKFGGSSVATAERITAAARKAIRAQQSGWKVMMVVSARGDTTDELVNMAREITEQPPSREMDMLLSTGEQISIALMAMAIQTLGRPAISFTGAQIGIVTDSFHTKARIKNISTDRMKAALQNENIVIVAGFQGIDEDYNITTLGRGGSDTTAVALAAVMKLEPDYRDVACEIYTDVDGIFTTDPRIVAEACKIPAISYDEMLELASVGAGVMHSRSIEFAKKFDVPLQVRSSFSDVEGTWIVPENATMLARPVCGAAIVRDEARISIVNVPDEPGISHRIFSAIAEKNIVVDMIVQNAGTDGRAEIGFTVLKNDLSSTIEVLRPLADELDAEVRSQDEVSKVSVVGAGMRTHAGVADCMFAALAEAGINIRMITTSDIKISVLVDKPDGLDALRIAHQAFALHEPDTQRRRTDRADKLSPVDSETAVADVVSTIPTGGMEDIVVSDAELDLTQGRISIYNLPDRPGVCSKIFSEVARAGIVVDMIVQNVDGMGYGELSFSVDREKLQKAAKIAEAAGQGMDEGCRVVAEADIAKVSVSGVGMRTHTGVAQRMFGALADQGINIAMISTSEVRIGVVVASQEGPAALDALKNAFNL